MPDTGPKSSPGSNSQSWSSWAAEHEGETPLACGSVLRGRFVLEEVIGTGGMGHVYRALDRRREEAQDRHPHVAIKVLAGEFRRHPDALKALQREARKAQKLAHPNIGSVHDFDRDGSNVYLVMDLLEGEPLNEVIKARAGVGLGLERALQVIEELGIALAYAHSRGIVHSDFKPSNVFLTREGEVKVIDFGIARAARTGPGAEDVSQTVFDAGKLGAATLAYASPEQLLGVADPDARDDVYSLAVVAYELLAGRHPYDRRSALEAQLQEMKVAPVTALSEGQNAMLSRALAFKREHRPSTINDFMVGLGLQPVLRTMVTAHVSPGASDQETRMAVTGATVGKRSKTAALLALGLAAALLLGGGSFYAHQLQQDREERQRQAEEEQRRAVDARVAREKSAREAADRARRDAEARAAAAAQALVERERLEAEAQAERERLAREQDRAAARRASRKQDAAGALAPAATTTAAQAAKESTRPGRKPGAVYRWEDDTGEVHYGTQVPPEYAGKAVPVAPAD